jgi:hypothetical protein
MIAGKSVLFTEAVDPDREASGNGDEGKSFSLL